VVGGPRTDELGYVWWQVIDLDGPRTCWVVGSELEAISSDV
jgi:hypothetical protein